MVGVKNLTFLELFMVATKGYFIRFSISFIQSITHCQDIWNHRRRLSYRNFMKKLKFIGVYEKQ
jgi:hypothetical protein